MVGLSSTQLWGYRVPEALTCAAELGYDIVEVWAEHVWTQGDDPEAVRWRAVELGLTVTVHSASWDLNLTARNAGVREASVQQVIRSIDLARAIGAAMITVHPGRTSLHGCDLPFHWELQVEAFRTLAEAGAQRRVQVNVELVEPIKREFLTEPEDANRLLAAVAHPNLGVTFDVAHIPLDRSPGALLRTLHRLDEVHLSDATAQTLHVPLGQGGIDLGAAMATLVRYGVPIVIEGYQVERTTELAAWNKRAFDQLWERALAETAGASPD